MRTRTLFAVPAVCAVAAALAGCGGSGGNGGITIPKARVFRLTDWSPAKLVPGRTEHLSFVIQQPSGQPLTHYRCCAGPHTGVHLIIVRDDLSTIIHRHPPLGKGGRFTQALTFPTAGRYRVVVDAYPKTNDPSTRNFQLFRSVIVGTGDRAAKLPPPGTVDKVDGYTFTVKGVGHLKALAPGTMKVTVRTPGGRPAKFIPYYGALAHAIFFRRGSLDYFHTHVCGPDTPGCTSFLGAVKVRGTSTAPGELNVGVLVPVPGTWRLFLQAQVAAGRVLTAPFTLKVAA